MDDNQIPVEIIKTPPPISSYFKTLSAVLGIFVLVTGLGIAVKLSQQKQDTRTKASADMVDLSLSPDQIQVEPNQKINIAVGMNTHNYKVSAVDLKIAYNSTIFDFVSFTKTNVLPTVLITATGVNGLLNTVLGSEANNPQMGNAIIGNLVLRSKSNATGSGVVHIDPNTQVAGIDSEGNAVATNLLGNAGEISINIITPILASPTPTPTPPTGILPSCVLSDIQPASGPAPLTVTLHGGGRAGGSGIVGYQWDFENNGSWDTGVDINPVTHTYDAMPGWFQAIYRVQDQNGNWSENCFYKFPITIITSTPAPSPTPTAIPVVKIGDANNDGKVDGADYTAWLLHYGETTPNRALDGDFNEDGRVDGIDYSVWLLNYQ